MNMYSKGDYLHSTWFDDCVMRDGWWGWATLWHPVGGSLLILTLQLTLTRTRSSTYLTVGPHCVVNKQDKSLECRDAPRHPLPTLHPAHCLHSTVMDGMWYKINGVYYDNAYLALGAPSPPPRHPG